MTCACNSWSISPYSSRNPSVVKFCAATGWRIRRGVGSLGAVIIVKAASAILQHPEPRKGRIILSPEVSGFLIARQPPLLEKSEDGMLRQGLRRLRGQR